MAEQSEFANDALLLDFERRFLNHRRELLDDRAAYLNRWLQVVALILTFFGLIVPLFGLLGYRRLERMEREARKHLDEIERMSSEVHEIRRKTAQDAADNPQETNRVAGEILERLEPTKKIETSPVDVAISEAITAQYRKNYARAIDKWKAVAGVSERLDQSLAARAWFSIGFLHEVQAQDEEQGEQPLEAAIKSYDQAIRLVPNYAEAYYNRANTKVFLKLYDDAIHDFNRSIELRPTANSYYNRANVHFKQGDFRSALSDYNDALSFAEDHGGSRVHILHNKANTLLVLGNLGEAQRCLDRSVEESPTSEATVRTRTFVESLRRVDSRETIQAKHECTEDGGLQLTIELEASPDDLASVTIPDHTANYGSVGSIGGAKMPGGEGGEGENAMSFVLEPRT